MHAIGNLPFPVVRPLYGIPSSSHALYVALAFYTLERPVTPGSVVYQLIRDRASRQSAYAER